MNLVTTTFYLGIAMVVFFSVPIIIWSLFKIVGRSIKKLIYA